MRIFWTRLALGTSLVIMPNTLLARYTPTTYVLAEPWQLETDDQYSYDYDYQAPKSRHGLVVHGYRYDQYESLWPSKELESAAAEKCDGKISYPFRETQHTGPGPYEYTPFPITEFWLVHSEPEVLLLERRAYIAGTEQCEAQLAYRAEVTRSFISNGMITSHRTTDGKSRIETVSESEGQARATHGRFPLRNMREVRKRLKGRSSGRKKSSLGVNIECFYTGSSLDRATACYLLGGGKYTGLPLDNHFEHTASAETGIKVTYLSTESLIDGRLFEWDRKISLATDLNAQEIE